MAISSGSSVALKFLGFTYEEELPLYAIRDNEKFEIMVHLDGIGIEHKPIIGRVRKVFILQSLRSMDRLTASLRINGCFGVFFFVTITKNNVNETNRQKILYSSICSKSDGICTHIPILEVLWKYLDQNVWIRGMVIGGIDCVRINPLKFCPNKANEPPVKTINEEYFKSIAWTDSLKKLMEPYKIRTSRYTYVKKTKDYTKDIQKVPLTIDNWDNCQEIRTDYILPKEKDLPFDGKVIGLYVPNGVKCLLLNRIMDIEKNEKSIELRQTLDGNKLHPILLLENSFLWFEAFVEMNPMDDNNFCRQPLEYTALKHLIIEGYIVGDTDGIEYQEDLFGKVLILNLIGNGVMNWSIEVCPLVYPTFQNRRVYINIPTGGQIEIRDWDKAFEMINSETNGKFEDPVKRNSIENGSKYPLKRWIKRNFNTKVYKFIDDCLRSKILVEIPATLRYKTLNIRESLLNHSIDCITNFSDVFIIFENREESDKYWLLVTYTNFYIDHYGIMKMNKNTLPSFEYLFKTYFYNQYV